MKFFMALLLTFLYVHTISAQSVLITEESESILVDDNIEYLIDDENLSISEVLNPKNNKDFQKFSGFNIKLAGSKLWFKVRVYKNHNPFEQYVLNLDPPFLRQVEFYVISQQGFVLDRKVYHPNVFFYESPMTNNYQYIKFEIPNGEYRDIYIKVRPIISSSSIFKIQKYGDFVHSVTLKSILEAASIGCMFIAAMIGFFFWAINKRQVFLYYSLYLISLVCSSVSFTGLSAVVFKGESSLDTMRAFTDISAIVFFLFFTIRFLEVKKNFAKLHKTLIGTIFFFFFGIGYLFISSGDITSIRNVFYASIVFVALLSAVVGIRSLFTNRKLAITYLGSWSILFLGFAYCIFQISGIIAINEYFDFVLLMTFVLQAGFLIFGQKLFEDEKVTIENKAMQSDQFQQLLRTLSHDLANPLSVAITFVKKFDKSNLDEKQLKYISNVERANQSMADIIRDIKELMAISAGKKEFNLMAVNLQESIDKAKFLFESKLLDKQINLTIEWDDKLQSKYVLGEEVGLSTNIINNIVSNAIKFSFENSTIRIRISELSNRIIVSIQDHGMGMPEEIKLNLFDQHKPTTRPGTANEKGTGFGMPIVKGVVERYEGEILFESYTSEDVGEISGTTFHILLTKLDEDGKKISLNNEGIHKLSHVVAVTDNVDKKILDLQLSDLGQDVHACNNLYDLHNLLSDRAYSKIFICSDLIRKMNHDDLVDFKENIRSAKIIIINKHQDVSIPETTKTLLPIQEIFKGKVIYQNLIDVLKEKSSKEEEVKIEEAS